MLGFKVHLVEEKGLTVVEILLGITILAIALIPVVNYFLNGTWLVDSSESRAQALKLARDSLELIRAEAEVNWSGLSVFIDNLSLTDLYDPDSEDYDILADYQLSATYLNNFDFNGDGDSGNDLDLGRAVIVKISWTDRAGAIDNLELKTLVANR